MKARRSSTKRCTQSNGASKQLSNGSCPSSLDEAREAGFIDYKFLDVEMNLPFVRAESYGKLEVRTTYNFYNSIYNAFNAGKYYKLNLFADLLFRENGMFQLESIGCDSVASDKIDVPIFTFIFRYRFTSYFIQQTSDVRKVDAIIAKLLNDMCKVCINSTLVGGYDDNDLMQWDISKE